MFNLWPVPVSCSLDNDTTTRPLLLDGCCREQQKTMRRNTSHILTENKTSRHRQPKISITNYSIYMLHFITWHFYLFCIHNVFVVGICKSRSPQLKRVGYELHYLLLIIHRRVAKITDPSFDVLTSFMILIQFTIYLLYYVQYSNFIEGNLPWNYLEKQSFCIFHMQPVLFP